MEPSQVADITHILDNLRDRDVDEVHEYGFKVTPQHFEGAELLQVFQAHKPAAVVAFHALTPRALAVSMLATHEWPDVARDVVRWAPYARGFLLGKGFVRAECRTMDGHADALRALEHFGFRQECRIDGFGSSGRTFLQYAWRLNDVSFSAKNPRAATASQP